MNIPSGSSVGDGLKSFGPERPLPVLHDLFSGIRVLIPDLSLVIIEFKVFQLDSSVNVLKHLLRVVCKIDNDHDYILKFFVKIFQSGL